MKKVSLSLFIFCVLGTFLWLIIVPLPVHAVTLPPFNYTGAVQNFVVPAGVTSITIQAFGAQGGTGVNNGNTVGGQGGSVTATIAVTPGETLYIYVGGHGGNGGNNVAGSAGFNGGGAGNSAFHSGGGGGGASDVRQGIDDLNHRVVVAGGGGGSGAQTEGGAGGDGGGTTGANGGNSGFASGGGGGSGTGGSGGFFTGAPGVLGIGGAGSGLEDQGGGGGGGGYYGGGGGGSALHEGGGGGGGGSSFTELSALNVIHQQGVQTGDGQVIITYSIPVPTLSEWGMIIFMVLAGLGSVYYLRRRKRA